MGQKTYDIIIIGGAIMGSSAAYWLAKMAPAATKILVIESDPSYKHSSTALSVASIRQQFTTEVNVKISQFGIDFIKYYSSSEVNRTPHSAPLGFKENGYLFLAGSKSSEHIMLDAVSMQHRNNVQTQILDKFELKTKFPWLQTSDVFSASFGPINEGWFDNMALLDGFKSYATAHGVDYLTDRVVGLSWKSGQIQSVKLASGASFDAGIIVNAAGTASQEILGYLHEEYPVEPRKRTVFMIDAPNIIEPSAPLLVCHSGFYLRPEHKHWICAMVPDNDQCCDPNDFEPDLKMFNDHIWERLYNRAKGFDAVKVISAWAGHYAFNTLDQNAIIGRHPNWSNLFLMNGFSGHGLQQAPAVGRGIAELITTGAFQSIDLSELGVERILNNKPFREQVIV